MSRIQQLPQAVIEKIAAGEVVERPASVIKELVENSIDANAKNITVRLLSGGKKLIEVTDDGEGILPEDLKLTIHQHATSKIKSIDDLSNITTLGFRGEALFSISAVSKFTIISRHKTQKIAYKLEYIPPNPPRITPAPHPIGTSVSVKDIFFNLPARKQFLKSDRTELNHIVDLLEAFALSHPSQNFSLHHNEKLLLEFKTSSIVERFAKILKISPKHILSIKKQYYDTVIDILMPSIQTQLSTPSYLRIFVNGRLIYSNLLAKAIKDTLYDYLPKGTPIAAIAFINVPPHTIDVNIHPRKLEINFANPYRIYNSLSKTIHNLLQNHKQSSSTSSISFTSHPNRHTLTKVSSKDIYIPLTQDSTISRINPSDSYKLMDSAANLEKHVNNSNPTLIQQLKTTFNNSSVKNAIQVFNKYILYEIGTEIWIVDQHAAYERIRYEKILRTMETQQKITQKLLNPLELKLPSRLLETIDQIKDTIKQMGFRFEVNKDTIKIFEIPNIIKPSQAKHIFLKLSSSVASPDEAIREFSLLNRDLKNLLAATLACHTAIRTGDKLSHQEAMQLLTDLLQCSVPISCPHGRPTIRVLKITDIDKLFLRTY